MWVDWALFKVLTVIGWGISLWSLILAWTWLAEAKQERKELNLLYYVYEKIRIARPMSMVRSEEGCFELLASYQLFPALVCEKRTIELVSTQICCSCGRRDDDDDEGKRPRRQRLDCPSIGLCPAPGSTLDFCVAKDGDSMTYWADLTQQTDGAGSGARCQPFLIRGTIEDTSSTCTNAHRNCCLELVFHSTGSYFYCQIVHIVRIPMTDLLVQ